MCAFAREKCFSNKVRRTARLNACDREERKGGQGAKVRIKSPSRRYILGISGGVSFFTYLPSTPSLIVLKSLFLRDSILKGRRRNQNFVRITAEQWCYLTYRVWREFTSDFPLLSFVEPFCGNGQYHCHPSVYFHLIFLVTVKYTEITVFDDTLHHIAVRRRTMAKRLNW